MTNQAQKHPDSDLIDLLGGTSRVAELFDVQPPSVSGWRTTGLPKARRMHLQAIRPDLFPPQSPQSIVAAEKKRNGGVRLPVNPDRLK
jgi:hypothetical protein